MIINGERALAYIVIVDDEKEIAGADNIKLAIVKGWNVIVKKDELFKGDKGVFFEIDSKLPSKDERFWFLEPKHYKIKTMKLGKFGVFSQGLLMPLSLFPELEGLDVGTDVTAKLGVKYSVDEDNIRKAKADPDAKYKSMASRHKKLFSKPIVRKIMRTKIGKKIMFLFFGKRKDKPMGFPTKFGYVHKTDEDRIENLPNLIGYPNPLCVSEKLDGTSSTYILERKGKKKFEFYVCSRNVRLLKPDQPTYHDHNIYWDMAFKYDIENELKEYLLGHPELTYVCIQGEAVGSVQGNPLKLKEDDLYVFNFIRSDFGRLPSVKGKEIIEGMGMKFVPILDTAYFMPDNMEAVKEYATAKSAINPQVLREGVVLRDPSTDLSFKNVSREYLLKHQ